MILCTVQRLGGGKYIYTLLTCYRLEYQFIACSHLLLFTNMQFCHGSPLVVGYGVGKEVQPSQI